MKKIIAVVYLFFLFSVPVFAQQEMPGSTPEGQEMNGRTDCRGEICLKNPLGVVDSPQVLIGQVINNILGIVGSLALVMFIYGGLIWMTSSGSSEKVKQGRDILIWSIIGLVVIFSSYALVRFVIMGVGA